jgi:ribosomal protein S18 acetylase RimI-like enzyme
MEITLAKKSEAANIVSVLDEVTLTLLEKENNQWAYPWYCFDIEKEIERGYQYIVREADEIIAVFSIKPVEEESSAKRDLLAGLADTDNKKSCYLYRIAVLPEFQGKNIGKAICLFAVELSKREDLRIFIKCSEQNEYLNKFFRKAGFYYFGKVSESEEPSCIYSFSPEDTQAKNRIKNTLREKKKPILTTLVSVMCLLAMALIFAFTSYQRNQVELRPGITVGDYTYWLNDEYVLNDIPLGFQSVGTLEAIVRKDKWPDNNLEAVGLPESCIGEEVYLGNQDMNLIVFQKEQNKYLYFERFYENQNYSNGFYQYLLTKCTRKKVVPIKEIDSSYSLEEALLDGCAVFQGDKAKEQEFLDSFLQKTEKGKKGFLRIMILTDGGTKSSFMDLFYDGENYFIFYSEDPDLMNLRYTYLFKLEEYEKYSEGNLKVLAMTNKKELTLDEIFEAYLSSQYVASKPYHVLFTYTE